MSGCTKVLTKWSEQHATVDGTTYKFIEWMPEDRGAMKFVKLTTKSLRGVKNNHCFSMTRLDRRRISLWGRGADALSATGVAYRNHMLSKGCDGACESSFVVKCPEDVESGADSVSEAEAEAPRVTVLE